jgi:excisionase family DNA binding protein
MKRDIPLNIVRQETPERFHSIPEAADRLGLSHWTLWAWVRDRKIATNKLGRRRLVPESEIQRLIAESYQPAS